MRTTPADRVTHPSTQSSLTPVSRLPVKIQRSWKPLPPTCLLLKSERAPERGNVGAGMKHVARARGLEARVEVLARQAVQLLDQLQQGDAVAPANVEHPARHALTGGFRRQQIGSDHVFDESEIARLAAIPKNHRRLAF